MKDLQLPTIHLNGTGAQTLRDHYERADDALYEFIEAFQAIEFNARDYYVDGPEAWGKAVEARQEINRNICEIQYYIDAHRDGLQP